MAPYGSVVMSSRTVNAADWHFWNAKALDLLNRAAPPLPPQSRSATRTLVRRPNPHRGRARALKSSAAESAVIFAMHSANLIVGRLGVMSFLSLLGWWRSATCFAY
jgi:hypothetical protein